jgi:two-component system phosphate regulon sensor histidine kinase PhoR
MSSPVSTDGQIQSRGDKSSALYELIESSRECVIVVGDEMLVVAANQATRAAFSRGETLDGRRLSEVIRDADLHDAFRRTLEQREASDLRLEYSAAGGSRVFDIHISPIDLDGRKQAIAFFHDITQIERLEKIRQEFLSNISHELRTPLTSILAFVETLEDGAIDEQENNRRFLGVIKRNAERMRALISDILELSLIESGNVAIELRDVELRPFVDAIFDDLASKAAERRVDLINQVRSGINVRCDPMRFEQMLTNLIDNAIKFNREGGSVTVEIRQDTKSDLISVADTGEGILPEHLGRIFERFYRADRARTSDIGGTGLGLAIVKHLARLHGGEVSLASELATGSTFTIELPRSA